MTDTYIIVRCIRRNITFFHGVDDRLDVASAERDVVGHACGAVGVEVDRSGRRAARRLHAKRSVLELQERFDVEVFRLCSRTLARRASLIEPDPSIASQDVPDILGRNAKSFSKRLRTY